MTEINKAEFLANFSFNQQYVGYIGVEREYFLVRAGTNVPVPEAPAFLARLSGEPEWTYEFSACQVEVRTPPCATPAEAVRELCRSWQRGVDIARSIGVELRAMELGPEDMCLDVYPDTRYLAIKGTIHPDRLRAAMRVAGTHVHRGVASIEDAIQVYERLRSCTDRFLRMGDHSGGERIKLFESTIYPQAEPPPYPTVDAFWQDAQMFGFADDVRRCWRWIRPSRHGTVEVRTFGSVEDQEVVGQWAAEVQRVAKGE